MKKYLLVAALILTASRVLAADDSLAAAKDLYAAASYEDALAMLGRLNAAELPPDQGRAADQYRALCLLALGKTAEASQAIEAVVSAEPLYHPTDGEVSPRVRAVFTDVRKRLLPGLVQQEYAIAKTAFDHKDYRAASSDFGLLLALYDDPDLSPASSKPPLSDLRVLIDGFHALSLQALAPPPAPEPPPVAVAPPPKPAVVVAPVPEVAKIYMSSDANVVLPVTIRQDLPRFNGVVPRPVVGTMEVVIDETGKVVSAAMRASTLPPYDRQAVTAAQSWRYQPATVNGTPVKFRKLIQVALTPQ
ncbi:MAG TPA: energy transducer TonB [Vicinamibacterales bacterium]|nr:energy transducer TonB [Vicinamibacterales bacterium]